MLCFAQVCAPGPPKGCAMARRSTAVVCVQSLFYVGGICGRHDAISMRGDQLGNLANEMRTSDAAERVPVVAEVREPTQNPPRRTLPTPSSRRRRGRVDGSTARAAGAMRRTSTRRPPRHRGDSMFISIYPIAPASHGRSQASTARQPAPASYGRSKAPVTAGAGS